MKIYELLEKGINKVRLETWQEGSYVVIGKHSNTMYHKEDRLNEKHHCLFNGFMLTSNRWEEYNDKISVNPNAYSICAGRYINEVKNIRKYEEDKYYRWYTDGRIVEEKDHNQGYEFENGAVTTGTITATEVELRWQIKTLEWEIERLKKENEILLETLQEELKKGDS